MKKPLYIIMDNSEQPILSQRPALMEQTPSGVPAKQAGTLGSPFWYVLALAFAVRAVLSARFRSHWFITDTADYLRMAGAIHAHHPYSFFPNGYPLLIAAFESLLPPHAVPMALIFVNVLAGTAVVAMVHSLTLRLTHDPKAACAAALAVAVYPNQLDYTFQLMTETCSAFLLSLAVVCLLSQRPLASGWWLYLASTFRATLSLAGPVLLLVGLILRQPKADMGKLAAGIALGWLAFFALERFHVIEPASNLNANLLISINGDSEHINFSYNGASPQVLRAAPAAYVSFARTHPLEFARQRAIALYELWGPLPGPGGDAPAAAPRRSIVSRLLIGLRFPLFLLALWGGWNRRREFAAWALLAPILLITAVHTMTFATSRFSYPVEPLAIALAAVALFDWRHKRSRA